MRDRNQRPTSRPPEEILEASLTYIRRFLKRRGRPVLIAAAVALVALLAYRGYSNKARRDQAESWRELATLPTVSQTSLGPDQANTRLTQVIEGCKSILEGHWKTDATPWVLLTLANAQRSRGFLEEALETYRRLEKEYPSHYAAGIAAPNPAGVLEEMGRFEEAARAYETLAQRDGGDSLYWADAGRCWEMAGNSDAAARAYQKVAAEEGFALAASRLKSVTEGKPLLAPPPHPEGTQPPELPMPGEGTEVNDQKKTLHPP